MVDTLQQERSRTAEAIHFVTGRLAENALRSVLAELGPRVPFQYTVQVMPITVAALMTPHWIATRLEVPPGTHRVILPGYCQGDLDPVCQRAGGARVERGPRDLRDLPEYFGQTAIAEDYGTYDIEILAEINHAPRLTRQEILATAEEYRKAGADIIDLGCDPDGPWLGVADCVAALRDAGYRVSIDSLDPREIEPAVRAGAELVLSVNSRNRQAACDWGCEVVVIPDQTNRWRQWHETIEFLAVRGVPIRLDPILEPIGCGFAASLARYAETRHQYPDLPMLMGIGNLTELSDCDSAAVNLLLMGFCQELGIRSVLTTQVAPWTQSTVRECDVARRLVYYAVRHGTPPKRLDTRLIMLRDAKVRQFGRQWIEQLAQQLKDPNYRIFAEGSTLHLVSAGLHLEDDDPFALFQQLLTSGPSGQPPKNLDLTHAFYLGYELSKAVTALTLNKQYRQDEALEWGLLTRPERPHRNRTPVRAGQQVAAAELPRGPTSAHQSAEPQEPADGGNDTNTL